MNILEEIAEKRRIDIENRKEKIALKEIKDIAEKIAEKERKKKGEFDFLFQKNLSEEGISFICEVKKASPSKGIIAEEFPYLKIAQEYEEAGAAAVSVLTEPNYFLGRDEYLKEISEKVSLPLLRKDFTIDEYQIYEAKTIGASAILLICALLSDRQLESYIKTAEKIGLSALTEAHDEREIHRALQAGAKIVGVNNRDLKTFTVDIQNSINLRKLVPKDILFVSESGIRTSDDIAILKENGTDAVLIGETLMRSPDKKAALNQLSGKG